MFCTAGEETWRQKESRVTEGVPPSWGDHLERSLTWEGVTAVMLLNAGAEIIVLRHPNTVTLAKTTIDKLMSA
jgi:CO dehydrogenase/acetyl-CoA synthase delta subunit